MTDSDDEHILAAAIYCDADFLVTKDEILIADPKAKGTDIKLIRPDDLLVNHLCINHPNGVRQSVRDHIASLTTTKPTRGDYVQSLERVSLLKFASWIENIA